MRTGLTKKEKTTAIYFDEYGSMIEVQTHNTNLKKRLTAFAVKYPECCRQIDDDEQGGLTFEVEKVRLSFRLTAPYSEFPGHPLWYGCASEVPSDCAVQRGTEKSSE